MPLSPEQLAERTQYIGASDVPAILGISPWKSAYDLWMEKTHRVEPRPPTEVMRRGIILEPAILTYAEEELGPLERTVCRPAPDGLPITANCDALLIATGEPVEAKSSAVGGFGEGGTDDVPDYYIVQCQVQMFCTGTDLCYLVALLGGRGLKFEIYRIPRVNSIIERILEDCVHFWEKHVEGNVPPPDSMPTLEVIKYAIRVPNRVAECTDEDVQRFLDAKATAKEADKIKDAEQAQLLALMGDAEAITSPSVGTFTYLEQDRRGFDAKGLKLAHPEIAKEFERVTSYRVLRHKKPRG